jgi:hypothetical protein
MGILAGDIKLVRSQVMDDVPEGGGAPIDSIVVDGTSNGLFNDISELDRAGGRVNARKVFVSIRTPDREGYFGANVIVSDPPDDPNVSVSLFTTGDVFDRRSAAISRVEAYLNAGPEFAGYLFENHITGQRSIQIFARTTVTPPPIGRTLLLRQNEGLLTVYEQYVRVTRVITEERTFTTAGPTDFQALVITCDISDRLRYDFTGSPSNRFFTRAVGSAILRDTVVADAAVYGGVVPLADPVEINDTSCMAEGIYTQLVPNSRTETSLVDQKPSADFAIVLASSPRAVTVGGSPLSQRIRIGQENRGFNYVTILSPLPGPGTVRVNFRALGNSYTINDNGDGTLGGASESGTGTVNYSTGSVSVTLNALPDDRSAVVFYWGEKSTYTDRAGVIGYRPPEFSFSLEKQGIIPGTVEFAWESGGSPKTATANSAGVISGDATGEVNHNAGVVYIRPTAMLDAGGQIEISYQWADIEEELHSGLSPDGAGAISFTLASAPVPGTVELLWVTSRETSVSSGAVSAQGSSSKSTSASTSVTMLEESRLVPPYLGTVLQFDGGSAGAARGYAPNTFRIRSLTTGAVWEQEGTVETTRTPLVSTRSASSSNGSSYSTTEKQTSRSSVAVSHHITDDGAGSFFGALGTVGYVSKAVVIKVQGDYSENTFESTHEDASTWESLNATTEPTATTGGSTPPSADDGGGGSSSARGGSSGSTTQKEIYATSSMIARYRIGTAVPASRVETYTPPGVTIDLTPFTRDYVVPGSVRFLWMGHVYQDFDGKIYRDPSGDDPGTRVGSVTYYSGVVAIGDYVVGASPQTVTIQSMFTTKRTPDVANITFNTPASPIKPSALTLSVVDATGTQIIATAETDGDIVGPHTRGKVDYESGLVEVQFGDYVLNSGLTDAQKAEWWYDADNVRTADGKIWRPWPVDPETLRYAFVSFVYLPLDSTILGMDPVRLPQDGRVPIFRPGSFAVLGHTATRAPEVVANGNVKSCGRVRLSRVRVIGNDGDVIDTGYTANLDAGTVTFTDVSGYSQPVTIEHRVEDMAMVSDVQINGKVSFTRPITHEYPVPGSYLSSALVAGDLRSRVSVLFDQQTWTGVWSDSLIGAAATATFNDISHPIQVTNEGALTERWFVQFASGGTTFNVIGEHVGVIATGNTSSDCAPINPATGAPYFVIPYLGWGLGWAVGNVLRFNTVGTFYPVWLLRTIQQGPETEPDDSFTVLVRGDVDRP